MTNDELKKRLSVLRTTPVPPGYWDRFWPRLRLRLNRPPESPAAAPSAVWGRWAPVCAGLLIGLSGYWLGEQRVTRVRAGISSSPFLLTSGSTQADAQRAFKEMLDLFPSRVNWISFVDGKVDFSISSVAYKDRQTLVPMILSIPRGNDPFHAQLLIRPGQDAILQAPWDAKTTFTAKLQLDAQGRELTFSLRLSQGDQAAALEGAVHPKDGESVTAGSLRWDDRVLPVQIARLSPAEASAQAPHAKANLRS